MRHPIVQLLIWLVVAAAVLGPEVWLEAHAVPGGTWTDTWNSLWSMHFAHQSVASGQLPWWTDALNYPDGGSVLLPDALGSLFAVAAVPVLGLSGAYTAWVTLQLALGGWAMQGFSQEWLSETLDEAAARRAAWVAGLAYATAPVLVAGAACGTTEAVAGAPPVLAAWAAWRATQGVNLRSVGWVSGAMLLAAAASWYAAVIAAVFVAIVGCSAWRTQGPRAVWPLLAGLAVVAPLALGTHAVHVDPGHLATRDPAILDAIRASFGAATPLGLVWPVDSANIAVRTAADVGQGYLHTGYLGWALLAASAVAVVRCASRTLPWLVAGVSCTVLALGPGDTGLLPYAWVDGWPGFKNLSLVWRLASGGGLALALLAALATRGQRLACWGLAAAVLVEVALFAPTAGGVATSDTSPQGVLSALKDAPRGAVLTLPAAAAHADLWRQTQHGQPLTGTINHRRSEAAAVWAAGGESADWPALKAESQRLGIRYVLVYQSRDLQASSDRFLAHQLQAHARLLERDNRWSLYALW